MKKLKFTLKGKNQFDLVNQLLFDSGGDDYYDMTEDAELIINLGMFIVGAYVPNSFDNLDDFINQCSECEGRTPEAIKDEINEEIELEYVIIEHC